MRVIVMNIAEGGEVECDFSRVMTDNKIITRFHDIDHDRIIKTDAKSSFFYPDKDALHRLIQNESCYQTFHQLCQPWAHRLYEIDKKHEQQWKAKSYIHACHCLQYHHLLTINQTTTSNGLVY